MMAKCARWRRRWAVILELVVLAWRRRVGIDYPAAAETGLTVASLPRRWLFAAPVFRSGVAALFILYAGQLTVA